MVYIYLTKSVRSTKFFKSMLDILEQNHLPITIDHDIEKYYENFSRHNDIITWGVKIPLSWYQKHKNKNILLCENGLIRQGTSLVADHQGLYSDSTIAKDRSKPTQDEIDRLEKTLQKRLNLKLFGGYDKSGPILIAMQKQNDAPVKYYFHSKNGMNSWQLFISMCSKTIGNKNVIIRAHPRDDQSNVHNSIDEYVKGDWRFTGSSGSIYDLMPKCRAVVTINSTVATEAMAIGMPVATLGRGTFSGHGATLECYDDYNKLKDIDDFVPNKDNILQYLCSIIRHELPYSSDRDRLLNHVSFKIWLDKVIEDNKECIPKYIKEPSRKKRVIKDKFNDKLRKINRK